MEKREFKVGDRVNVISLPKFWCNKKALKKSAIITNILTSNSILLDPDYGGIIFSPENLELVENNITQPLKISRKALGEIYPFLSKEWKVIIEDIIDEDLFSENFEIDLRLLIAAHRDARKQVHKDWLEKYLPLPKRKVTREIVKWLNIYPVGYFMSESKELAIKQSGPHCIAIAVEMRGTYEIEE